MWLFGLLTIALWAKLVGHTHLRAIAEWTCERQDELAVRFALPGASMPHPTIWSRLFDTAVAANALESAISKKKYFGLTS